MSKEDAPHSFHVGDCVNVRHEGILGTVTYVDATIWVGVRLRWGDYFGRKRIICTYDELTLASPKLAHKPNIILSILTQS